MFKTLIIISLVPTTSLLPTSDQSTAGEMTGSAGDHTVWIIFLNF